MPAADTRPYFWLGFYNLSLNIFLFPLTFSVVMGVFSLDSTDSLYTALVVAGISLMLNRLLLGQMIHKQFNLLGTYYISSSSRLAYFAYGAVIGFIVIRCFIPHFTSYEPNRYSPEKHPFALAYIISIPCSFLTVLLYILSYVRVIENVDDFYHKLYREKQSQAASKLESERTRIINELRNSNELKLTTNALTDLRANDDIDNQEVDKLLQQLQSDSSSTSQMALAEVYLARNDLDHALTLVNSAIDASQLAVGNGNVLDPKLYELKARILNRKSDYKAAQAASDRFLELNAEQKFQANLGKEILLEKLELTDLPFYGTFQWKFNPGINILLGKNGYGKSHLLGLLATMLYEEKDKTTEWIPRNRLKAKARLYVLSDHPVNETLTASLEKQLQSLIDQRTKLKADLHSVKHKTKQFLSVIEYQEELARDITKTENSIDQTREQIDAEKRRILLTNEGIFGNIGKVPILAIPDGRFFDRTVPFIGNNPAISGSLTRDGASDLLSGRPIGDIIKKGLFIVAQNNPADFTKEPYDLIQRTIGRLAGNGFFQFTRIELVPATGDYRFFVRSEESEDEFELQKISQGTFSVLSLCLMIYRFLAELRPHSQNILSEKAIVLIDEIDAHLHPSWEQKIIGILRREFPNIQFIITGHSPLIVAGCPDGEVFVMKNTGQGILLERCVGSFIGMPAADIYTKVFDIEDRDEQYQKYTLLSTDEIREIEDTKNSLSRKKDGPGLTKQEEEKLKAALTELNNLDATRRASESRTEQAFEELESMRMKYEEESLKQAGSTQTPPNDPNTPR